MMTLSKTKTAHCIQNVPAFRLRLGDRVATLSGAGRVIGKGCMGGMVFLQLVDEFGIRQLKITARSATFTRST